MNHELIRRIVKSPTAEAIRALLDDEETAFWVDWREEDDAIVASCESIIKTGELAAEWIAVEATNSYNLFINYQDKHFRVPLTDDLADRHITICALNEALAPDYEVRFCVDSNGSDTLAFIPLPASTWNELEISYGEEAVRQRFYRIASQPNIFADTEFSLLK